MPSKAPHACTHPGCPALVTTGGRCPAHAKANWSARNARPEIARDKKFYDSALWQGVRRQVLMNEPWCRECRRQGKVSTASVVDHIKALRDGGARIDPSNLQPLCNTCHNEKRSKESRGL